MNAYVLDLRVVVRLLVLGGGQILWNLAADAGYDLLKEVFR